MCARSVVLWISFAAASLARPDTSEFSVGVYDSQEAAQKAFASFEDWLGSKLSGKDVPPIFDF